MIQDDLDLLLPGPPSGTDDGWYWATVTQTAPLRIRVDGDSVALPVTPDSVAKGLNVGDRVWVQRRGRRLVVLGRSRTAPTALGAAIDLNTVVNPDDYIQMSDAQAAGGSNYPVPYAGHLRVVQGTGGWVYQYYTSYHHGGSGGNRTYHRSLYSGTWSPWQGDNISMGLSSTTTCVFRDVCTYTSGSGGLTGNVVFDTPIPVNSAQMISVRIRGYNYLQGWSDLDVTVGFYCYAGNSTIINATSNSKGTLPVKVRLGVNNLGNVSIILTSQAPYGQWQYPQFVVEEVITGFATVTPLSSVGWVGRLVAEADIASTFSGIVSCATQGTGTITFSANYRAAIGAGRKPLSLTVDNDGTVHLDGVFENAVAFTGWEKNVQYSPCTIPLEWCPSYDVRAVGYASVTGYTAELFAIIVRGTNSSSDFSAGGSTGQIIWQALQTDSFASAAAGNCWFSVNDMTWRR